MIHGTTTLCGTVVKKLVHEGSRDEREAIVLQTNKKEYILRQQGGNPLKDPELEELIGKSIKGDGKVLNNTFILSDWEEE